MTDALTSFEENWKTISDLMSIGTEGTRTQSQRAAVNKAALIFVITAWESYVEDVVREATDLMATHCPLFQDIPESVRTSIVKRLTPKNGFGTSSPSHKRADELADDGWRALLRDFARDATEGGKFNTPSTSNVKAIFCDWVGIDVTKLWSWKGSAAPKAAERLDETIDLRGSIVHTGSKPDGLNKNWIYNYGATMRNLVKYTDAAVVNHVNKVCQVDAWAAPTP